MRRFAALSKGVRALDDIFDMNPVSEEQPENAGETRVMPPVEAAPARPARRRRTDRNADAYEAARPEEPDVQPDMPETQAADVQPETATPADEQEHAVPGETRQVPVSPAAAQESGGTTAVPRFNTRYNPPVPGNVPSLGVPRPAAVTQPAPKRPVFSAGLGEVRRPVKAEGYVPARPLGVSRAEQQEPVRRSLAHPEAVVQPQLQTGSHRTATIDDGDEYEAEGKGNALPIVIIVLLVIAALVLGMLLVPSDMKGPLGDVKRGIVGLFSGGEDKVPAQALGFTGDPTKDTVPYQITFHVTTTTNVSGVRVVNERGEVLNTTVTASIPNTSNMLHMLTMTLENEYEGYIYLQISDGENWLETDYSLQLTVGPDMKLKISDTSSTTLTAGSTAVAVVNPPLTAGSDAEPTVSPAVEETQAPAAGGETAALLPEETQAPVVTEVPAIVPTATPTAEPTATPTATPVATPTPTMALTPTPTVRVTATPTAAPTATPTAEPTPEPTPEPTATPVPTPQPTVKLEAVAGEGAAPGIISTQRVYRGTKRVTNYQREADEVINMPAGDAYMAVDFGVTTFRGNAFRMNAAHGTVENPASMSVAWKTEGGRLHLPSGWRYGFGVYSQPAIVKWTVESRSVMAMNEGYSTKRALKEVIIAGQDGKVYFLDLEDGQPTREAINIGYALRGAPSVHPLCLPVITFGQFSNKLEGASASKSMGLYYYNLATNKRLHLIDTLADVRGERAYYGVGAMDTSALIDRNSHTLVTVGTNGMLYTQRMNMTMVISPEGATFEFKGVEDHVALMSHTKNQNTDDAAVESSLAMYGSYAFYADMGGILRCVDTSTMTTVWAVNTGDAVRAAIALDLDEETGTLWLYTANTITNRTKNGDVTIRRYNAMTGEVDWQLPVNSLKKFSGQKDATGKDITAGAVASPIIGQHELGGLVYFTLSSVSDAGYAALTGAENAEKQPSVLVAVNKADGSVVWTLPMDAYSYSSPVAVYSAAGQGWVIQCCANGTIYLLDGLTGEIVNTLQVAGIIEGSPAVYNDMLVFGTTGKDKSFVYAIKLQ